MVLATLSSLKIMPETSFPLLTHKFQVTLSIWIYYPFLHAKALPSSTLFNFYLIMVDKTSTKPHLVGHLDYTSDYVITAVNEFIAPRNHPITVE
jgi:hypothetical protein